MREVHQRLGHLVAKPPVGVERGERVLEHHLHVATRPPQVAVAEAEDVGAVEQDLARPSARPAAGSSGAQVDLPQPDSPTSDRVWPRLT